MSRSSPKKPYDRSAAMKKKWAARKREEASRLAVLKRRSDERAKLYAVQCVKNTKLWDAYGAKFGKAFIPLKPWMFAAMSSSLASGIDNPRLVKAKGKSSQVSDEIWRELIDRPPRPYHTPSTQHVVRPL
jgi:hypothetical protein